jgi:transcriptional accessory protein Tex/SPT6
VISRGDVLDVLVQEVDKMRGRIGLKLVAKHENGNLVQPEELIERAKDAPPRERREREGAGGDRRGGRRRGPGGGGGRREDG